MNRTKMLVPENQQPPRHAVSMFMATAGAGGNLLGSDEKEIIYLVFGIIDLQNKEVSDHPKKKSGPRSIREIPEKHVFSANRVGCESCVEETRGRRRRLKIRIYQ